MPAGQGAFRAIARAWGHIVDKALPPPLCVRHAQVAELVDALASGASGASRGGSSPLLGTIISKEPRQALPRVGD